MSNTRKPRSLRDALKKRQVNTTHYDLPLVTYDEAATKKQDLTLATNTVRAAEFLLGREDRPDVRDALAAAREAEKASQAAVDACFHRIEFVGLPADEFDALVQLHPPTEEQVADAKAKGEDAPLFNREALVPELLERCAQGSDLTAAEWVEDLAGWTMAERAEISSLALAANVRSFSTSLSFV